MVRGTSPEMCTHRKIFDFPYMAHGTFACSGDLRSPVFSTPFGRSPRPPAQDRQGYGNLPPLDIPFALPDPIPNGGSGGDSPRFRCRGRQGIHTHSMKFAGSDITLNRRVSTEPVPGKSPESGSGHIPTPFPPLPRHQGTGSGGGLTRNHIDDQRALSPAGFHSVLPTAPGMPGSPDLPVMALKGGWDPSTGGISGRI
jgi:hypothetical protein